MASARDRILPPYTRRVDDWKHRAVKFLGVSTLILFAMFLGFWLAIFGEMLIQSYAVILGVLMLLLFWMAPDSDVDFSPSLCWYFTAYLACTMAWPGYVALNVPSLPWISPARVMFALLVLTFLLQVSQSKETRKVIGEVIGVNKAAFLIYGVFIVTQLITIPISSNPTGALNNVLTFIVMWNGPALIGLWIFTKKGMVERVYRTIIIAMVVVFLFCVAEYYKEHPIWAPYIPAFLRVDSKILETLLFSARRDDGRYRLRGMFPAALYFGQFVAIMTPFVMHAVFTAKPKWKPYAYALLVLLMFMAWGTNTRTAFSGTLLGIMMYVAFFALRRYLKPAHGADPVGPAALMAGPAFILVLAGLIMSSNTLQAWTIGGPQHAASNNVRDAQWDRAKAALMKNPIGHGAGRAPQLAGKPTKKGTWIIDSYWINLLLDYGILGFATFMGFFLLQAYRAFIDALVFDDRDTQICSVFAMSILLFQLTTYTLSFSGNFYFPMILAAGIAANRWRLSKEADARRKGQAVQSFEVGQRAFA